jgi:hypothetical protein
MTYTFKLARRIARFRAPLLVLAAVTACGGDKTLDPTDDSAPSSPVASATFAGGIPFGISAMPISAYGGRYNGALLRLEPRSILSDLAAIKARGGKVILKFAGHPQNYGEGEGFDLAAWKARVSDYKGIDLSPYIKDGTIVGHYMIDEPQDPKNWGGNTVSPSVLEEMGRFSKQLWPELPTIVRTEPRNLGFNHRYIDAAWAAYLARKGTPQEYISRNVAEAQDRGLALITGLNVLDGGDPKLTPMTPSEVQSWGSAVLKSTYPCAFISWRWEERTFEYSAMASAMDALRRQAENRATRTCRRAGSGTTTPPPDPTPTDPTPTDPTPTDPTPPAPDGTPGVLFGPYGLPTDHLHSFGASARTVTPSSVLAVARAVRQAGGQVILRFAATDVTGADGSFSLSKWKAAMDRYAGMDLASFMRDGTIAGHLLVQNPQLSRNWGGHHISHATLDEMARYSRQLWPSLPTIVQAPATWLEDYAAGWKYLDASSVVYSGSLGDAASWLGQQASAAGDARLGLLVTMNVLNGGTSASGLPGRTAGKYAMSATQLRSWGSTFLAHRKVCALLLTRYDSGYFGRADVKDALEVLDAKARARDLTPCRTR